MTNLYTQKLHEEYTAKDDTFKALIWKVEAWEGKDVVKLEWIVTAGCNDNVWDPTYGYEQRHRSLVEARIRAKDEIERYNKEMEAENEEE